MPSRKFLFLSLLILLGLASCNLGSRSIFSQVGDFERVDYNTDSPLYKGSTTGVAFGGGNLFVTSSRRLWRLGADKKWSDLTGSLPSPFNAAVDIVQLKGKSDEAYIALSGTKGERLGLYILNLTSSTFTPVGTPIEGQQPNRFFKIQDTDGDISQTFLYAQPSGETVNAKFVYDPLNFSSGNIGPLDDQNRPPQSNTRIIGLLTNSSPYTYIVTITFNNTEQSQIWTSDQKKPININPNFSIRLAGQFPVRGTTEAPVVSALSGATFNFKDMATGELEIDKEKVITGLSRGVQPNFYGYIDGVPVITTNFGYFETNDGKNLLFPTNKTTDVSSYTASQMGSMNIRGVYKTSDNKVYLTTWSKGLWERDPVTKKWSNV